MSYKRLNIKNGDVINDYHINYLQDAINKISSEGKDFKERLAITLTNKGIPSSKDETFDKLISKIDSLPNKKEQEPETIWPDIRQNIESGHIKLLVKTGDTVEFFVQATTASIVVVDWGDNTVNRYYISSGGKWISKTITASTGSTVEGENYKVAVVDISLDIENGAINRFQAPSNGNRNNLLWFCSKDIVFTNGNRMFNNNSNTACENLKYIDLIGGSINGNLEYFARWCSSIERIDANFKPGANTIAYAFDGCKKLKKPPYIDLTDVTSAHYLFSACNSMTEFDYYIKNNGSFTQVEYMFDNCTSLRSFVANQQFDFSKVNSQVRCFNSCSSLLIAPTIIFGTGSAQEFFYACTALTTIQYVIEANRVSNVSNFFGKCLSLVNGPTEFYANTATGVNNLFDECTSLQSVPTVLTFPSATAAGYLFRKCYRLKKAPTTINLPAATDIREMFLECSTLTTPPNIIEANSAVYAQSLFSGCTMLINAPTTINLAVAKNVSQTFYNCSALIKGPERYYAPIASDASSFFHGCALLKNAGTHFEIGNNAPAQCTFQSFFIYCRSLIALPTEGDMHQGWSYQSFFYETGAIAYESFEAFCEQGLSFPNATTFQNMFYNSTVTRIPSISGVKCTNAYAMYRNTKNLEYMGDINIPLCSDVNLMFYDAGQSLLDIGKLTLNSMSTNNSSCDRLTNVRSLTLVGLRTNFWLNNAKLLTSVRLESPNATLISNVEFQNCNMNAEALNRLLEDLPDRRNMARLNVNIKGNPGAKECTTTIGTNKNWNVIIQ